MTSESHSNFKALDLLNQSAALAAGGASEVRPRQTASTKFESVVNSLASFLTTASDTIITVDDMINGPQNANGDNGGANTAPVPAQHVTVTGKQPINFVKVGLWGGLTVGGSLLAYKLLATANKSN